MAIFAIAGLIGLFASWAWANFDPQKELQRCCAELLALVFLAVAGWLVLHDDLAGLSEGTIARAALGAVIGHFIYRLLTSEPTTGLISVALALVILASAAPHIDRWMSKLSGFKGAGFEFQLASTTTANKAITVAQSSEYYMSYVVFPTLKNYGAILQTDIDFIQLVELPKAQSPQERDRLQGVINVATEIKPVFVNLIGEFAECIDHHFKLGMSSDRIRPTVWHSSAMLQQIILNDGSNDAERHVAFWRAIGRTPAIFEQQNLNSEVKCKSAGRKYLRDHADFSDEKAYPRITSSGDLAYLYVPAALLSFFSGEAETALRILEKAKRGLSYPDHKVLLLLGQFRRYRGYPTGRIVEPYREMEALARSRKSRLPDDCAKRCDEKLRKVFEREVFYLRVAINNIAAAIADDLARGYHSAKAMEVTAESYVKLVEEILASKDLSQQELEPYIDTYAFAKIVLEAQKKDPDKKVIEKMARLLQGIVEAIQDRIDVSINDGKQPDPVDLYDLATARVHLNSARDLAGD